MQHAHDKRGHAGVNFLMFASLMGQCDNHSPEFPGLLLVGLGSLAMQRSIG
jgi:hypothetical protein